MMAQLEWEKDVLDAFEAEHGFDLARKKLEVEKVIAMTAGMEENENETVAVMGARLEKNFRKIMEELKAFRDATETSLKNVSQAQNHLRRLYNVSATDETEELPPHLRASQKALHQVVLSLFDSKFEEQIGESLSMLHRRLQILLEGNEAFEEKGGKQNGRPQLGFGSVLPVEDSAANTKSRNSSMYEQELIELRKKIMAFLPSAMTALQDLQIEMHSSALRFFTELRSEQSAGYDNDIFSTTTSTMPDFHRGPQDQGTKAWDCERREGNDSKNEHFVVNNMKIQDGKECSESDQRQRKGNILGIDLKLLLGISVGIVASVLKQKLDQRR